MSQEGVKHGEFIPWTRQHQEWSKRIKPENCGTDSCGCQASPFYFERCMLDTHPLAEIDTDDVFIEVIERLNGRVTSVDFENLSECHKCWCFYWYYAVNFYHVGGRQATKLPNCFVEAVRALHPDPTGKYTGHLTTEERRNKKQKLE